VLGRKLDSEAATTAAKKAPPKSKAANSSLDDLVAEIYADGPPRRRRTGARRPAQRADPRQAQGADADLVSMGSQRCPGVEGLVKRGGATLPANPRGGKFSVIANDFWATRFLRGMKARDAAEDLVQLLWAGRDDAATVAPANRATSPAAKPKGKRSSRPEPEDGLALGLKQDVLERCSNPGAISSHGQKKAGVIKPVAIKGRPYICTGSSWSYQDGTTFFCKPLYTLPEFRERFGAAKYKLRTGGFEVDRGGYAGVRVMVGQGGAHRRAG
jgi:hypothetical protein